MSDLLGDARGLLEHALAVHAASPGVVAVLRPLAAGLGGPLRVAVVGARGTGATTIAGLLAGARPALHVVERPPTADASDPTDPPADLEVHVVRALADPAAAVPDDRGGHRPARVLVLGRADEVGGGGVDALLTARGAARRAADDPALRDRVENAVAVAGLLAAAAPGLHDADLAALGDLTARPKVDLDALLASADRFTAEGPDGAEGSGDDAAATRLDLLDRLGLFGVRTATMLLRRGVGDRAALAAELGRRSGRDELLDAVDAVDARREVLRVRTVLATVEDLPARAVDPRAAAHLAAHVERVRVGAHALVEVDRRAAVRAAPATLVERVGAVGGEAERLLGARGSDPAARLGLPPGTGPRELREGALGALARWRDHAAHPLADRVARDTADAVVRSLEGVLADLAGSTPGPSRAVPAGRGTRPRPRPSA